MPYRAARDLVLDEISTTYGCNKRCLQEKLDDYYCNKAASKGPGCPDCKNAKVTPNSGMGTEAATNDAKPAESAKQSTARTRRRQ